MPPAERRALLLLLGLAVAGQGVRYWLIRPDEAPGQVQLLSILTPGSAEAQRDSAMRLGRPLAAGETIDVETASAAELARLPRVGPRLAKEIVANRETQGPFGGLAGLDRVSGVGPGLLKVIGPHVVFGGTAGKRGSEDVSGSTDTLRVFASPRSRIPASPLSLNTATLDQLLALPGIGPAKAAAVVRYRNEHGPFATPEDLTRVSGFGPAALARLKNLIAAP